MIYAGVGSRKTPDSILSFMSGFASMFASWVLRSGHAPGADQAFEDGAFLVPTAQVEIYLPWPSFEQAHAIPVRESVKVRWGSSSTLALDMVSQFHPNPGALTPAARNLHARNLHQVLGWDLTNPVPANFLICWTPDGADGTTIPTSRLTGGTGTAIRVANAYEVPVINLAQPDSQLKLLALLTSLQRT